MLICTKILIIEPRQWPSTRYSALDEWTQVAMLSNPYSRWWWSWLMTVDYLTSSTHPDRRVPCRNISFREGGGSPGGWSSMEIRRASRADQGNSGGRGPSPHPRLYGWSPTATPPQKKILLGCNHQSSNPPVHPLITGYHWDSTSLVWILSHWSVFQGGLGRGGIQST